MLSIKRFSFYSVAASEAGRRHDTPDVLFETVLCVSFLMPVPRASHDLVQLREPGCPPQLRLDLCRTRDEDRWVARPPFTFLNRNRPARHATHRLDNFE